MPPLPTTAFELYKLVCDFLELHAGTEDGAPSNISDQLSDALHEVRAVLEEENEFDESDLWVTR